MLDLFGDHLLMNGRQILTLPPGFPANDRMVLQELLDRAQYDGPPDPPDLMEIPNWECVLDPNGKLHELPDEDLRLPLPDGWEVVQVIEYKSFTEYTDKLT
jgi:hypothetical protein